MQVEERFLEYVGFPTTSDPDAGVTPSSDKMFALAKHLERELNELGMNKVKLDEHCYVYGVLSATKGMEKAVPFGFIAHMDTAPDFSGENIKPQIIKDYDGKDVLLKGSGEYIKTHDFPDLTGHAGKTLITTDGTTLLGADDKAGIAEIITALEQIKAENTSHGDIWVAFTPDEEIGAGTDAFDLDYFKGKYAYTLDGDYEGELAYENFYAATAKVKVHGVNVHPGSAKNIMKNAGEIAVEIQSLMDPAMTPQKTENREGFIHMTEMNGTVEAANATYIIRDHDKKLFEDKKAFMKEAVKLIDMKYGEGTAEIEIADAYSNMIEIMKDHMDIVEAARKAMRSAGIEIAEKPVRGGTDGAQLSFRGLPCPNLGTGGYAYHGPYEHITVEGMNNAIKTIKYLCANPSL